jgi:Spy/CpxP family protein refolding chaperone
MKKQILSTTFLFVALLLGGITACSHSNASDTAADTQSNPAATGTSDSNQTGAASGTQANSSQAERAQRRAAIRKQVEAVLTPDQQKQLQDKLQSGERMRQALGELNLTADQKAKIQEIYKTARSHQQQPQGNAQ